MKTFCLLFLAITLLVSTEAGAFCGNATDAGCHPGIVRRGLPFLRPEIIEVIEDHVNDPDSRDWIDRLNWESAEHFDNCNLDGGTSVLARGYDFAVRNSRSTLIAPTQGGRPWDVFPEDFGVLGHLAPSRRADFVVAWPRPLDAAVRFARLLHPAQDFYSHSNWVELGRTDLLDAGVGPWRELPSSWRRLRDDLWISQDDPPRGWTITFPETPRIPVLRTADGSVGRLVITGMVSDFIPNTCPAGARVSHGDVLNKDDSSRPFHAEAAALAVRQTTHEWCRLLHLARDGYGIAGVSIPLGLWVASTADPHPIGTVCAPSSPGSVEVTVEPALLSVLDNHEDGSDPAELALNFVAFTTDLTRSARSEVHGVSIHDGASVPSGRGPGPVTLCIAPNQTLAASVQGWDDDDDGAGDGRLDDDDDVFSGVTALLGRGDTFVAASTQSEQGVPDDQTNVDLRVYFDYHIGPTDQDHDGMAFCEERAVGTDPLRADTDGDRLNDGDEVRLGTDPLRADTDADGIADADDRDTYAGVWTRRRPLPR